MKLHHVSASQITTWRNCKRLWALEKLAGLRPSVESPSLTTGKEVHKVIEDYLHTGEEPGWTHEHSSKFQAVKPYLPPRSWPGLMVEHQFEFPVYPGGPPMVGAIDISLPPFQVAAPNVGDGLLWCAGVDDHKTTSDLRYAKTPEQLATNTQLIIYAYYLFRLPHLVGWNLLPPAWFPVWEHGLDRVRVRHNNIQTRGVVRQGKATQVEAYLDWADVAREWVGIVADVKEMADLAERIGDNIFAIINEPPASTTCWPRWRATRPPSIATHTGAAPSRAVAPRPVAPLDW